tara:strand:- start:1442 stop:1609 length:168 start_codon:yes stop_codon:yes gene_type:complete
MPYMIFEKDGQGTADIHDKEEAQEYVNKGYSVRIDKAGWGLKPEKKETKKKTKKS